MSATKHCSKWGVGALRCTLILLLPLHGTRLTLDHSSITLLILLRSLLPAYGMPVKRIIYCVFPGLFRPYSYDYRR